MIIPRIPKDGGKVPAPAPEPVPELEQKKTAPAPSDAQAGAVTTLLDILTRLKQLKIQARNRATTSTVNQTAKQTADSVSQKVQMPTQAQLEEMIRNLGLQDGSVVYYSSSELTKIVDSAEKTAGPVGELIALIYGRGGQGLAYATQFGPQYFSDVDLSQIYNAVDGSAWISEKDFGVLIRQAYNIVRAVTNPSYMSSSEIKAALAKIDKLLNG